jgi:GMP synthase-like glutamine amidotransferase
MRAHTLQHVPFEGLGSIEKWLRAGGYEITKTPFFQTTSLPAPDEIDFLIIMGGPMSVNDEGEHPWLVDEKRFIRRCIEAGKSVLGICLGAQLIASALGARVYRNPAKEIGWFPVQAIPSIDGAVFRFPSTLEVFHWHGETFDLPTGAIPLARSEGCENQAFQLGQSVVGLQFHLETTPESARRIVEHCREELTPALYIQSETAILAAAPEKYGAINNLMAQLLTFLQDSNR